MEAHFIAACTSPEQFPAPELPEVAVAGRSNCGKSSLINALTGHSKLARTSTTPGRTRQIIFFRLRMPGAPPLQLVDLPGYGFARVSHRERDAWAPLIQAYVEQRTTLRALLLLNDIRREPADEERNLLQWAIQRDLLVQVVLTKADKLSKSQRFSAVESARRQLQLPRRPLAVSTQDSASIEQLREQIALAVGE